MSMSQADEYKKFLMPSASTSPLRLTDVPFWHKHIPFAFALIEMIRPRTVVELGTHKGDSYSAFCQAVSLNGLDTRCYAIDNWDDGDPHVGAHAPSVYEDVVRHNERYFSQFSVLIKEDFIEALKHFQDQSIDLLHIDGWHSEEAVRTDYTTWFPKLSDRAVVLFHDTNVRKPGFGVWKFWEEIRLRYPSFEFPYGNGLGVLVTGKDGSPILKAMCDLTDYTKTEVTRYYHVLGERVEFKGKVFLLEDKVKAYVQQISKNRLILEEQQRDLLWYKEQHESLQQAQTDRAWYKERYEALQQAHTDLAWYKSRNTELEATKTLYEKLHAEYERLCQSRGYQLLSRLGLIAHSDHDE